MYKRINHIIDSEPLNLNDYIYFWYKRDLLQKEVRMRTTYLADRRRTKDGGSLLDVISMTLDEGDMFRSLYLDATANVYDALSGLMKHDTTSYYLTQSGGATSIGLPTRPFVLTETNRNRNGYLITLDCALDRALAVGQVLDAKVTVNYSVRYNVTGTSTYLIYSKSQEIDCEFAGSGTSVTGAVLFKPELLPATSTTGAEQFYTIVDVTIGAGSARLAPPMMIYADTIVENEGKYYRAKEDTLVLRLEDLERMQAHPGDTSDSVVYRLCESENFDTNAIPAIDICIFNMIVYNIMYSWLLTAAPEEADKFYALFSSQKDTLVSRINKSKTGKTEITPRAW